MTEYYQVVPWYNVEEWFEVYNNIYGENSTFDTKEKALQTLFIWKTRCPSLPSGIESTLSLLQVQIKDKKNYSELADNQLLRLSYSSAIMRFVNHMFDEEKSKSLYQAAQRHGVPDWIVDLRHDTAHSNNLPALELLREASSICLEWLCNKYWRVYSRSISNCIITKDLTVDKVSEELLKTFINYCMSLSICLHPDCNVEYLSSMPSEMQQSIIKDVKELFGKKINKLRLKEISLQSLMNYTTSYAKRFFNDMNKELFFELLLYNDSQILSHEICRIMCNGTTKYMNKQYVRCFEFLLKLLHSNDMLLETILKLIEITEKHENKETCQLAAKWISEILKALQRSQKFVDRIRENNLIWTEDKTETELVSLYYHWFPNEKENSLLFLDLLKPVPTLLTNINFIRTIITTYNPFLNYFIEDLLKLVRPALPLRKLNQICLLTKIIAEPEKFPTESSMIYTSNDLNNIKENCNDMPSQTHEHFCNVTNENIKEFHSSTKESIWKRASNNHSWSTCPIGTLPWQQAIATEMDID